MGTGRTVRGGAATMKGMRGKHEVRMKRMEKLVRLTRSIRGMFQERPGVARLGMKKMG